MAFEFNPYGTQDLVDDPYPVYRRLRDEYPAYYNDELRFWAVSRFDDVFDAIHDPVTYSSAQGITILDNIDDTIPPMMIQMDPPRHDQLRAIVNRAFTPKRISALEPRIRDITRELIADVMERGEGDLVPDLAVALPTIVIAELLGIPVEDRTEFRAWSDAMVAISPDTDRAQSNFEAAANLFMYFTNMIPQRRAEPRDDLMSAIIAAEVDGEHLSEQELVGFCMMLLLAGNETTTNLVSNGTVLLHAHPDQRAALAADPSGIGRAVEEMLRFDAPVQGLARTLTRDVEFHGARIAEGDKVLLLFASANRDEREFPDPDRFDVTRRAERTAAFGHGIHYCLGASLARLEGRIAFEALLGAMPEYQITTNEIHWNHLIPVRGVVSIPVATGPVRAFA